MLTNVLERGQRKCEQYWPDQGPQEHGLFTVALADQQVFADYTIRTLQVVVSLSPSHSLLDSIPPPMYPFPLSPYAEEWEYEEGDPVPFHSLARPWCS